MKKLLIKNAKCIATMDGLHSFSTGNEYKDYSIYCENGIIKDIFFEKKNIFSDIEIDASNHIVLPGLINTHHHFLCQDYPPILYPHNQNNCYRYLGKVVGK